MSNRVTAGRSAAVTQKRAASSALDLDAMEREGSTEPFEFLLQGNRYLLSDPTEVDWQDLLAALGNPHMFFRLVLPPDDYREFFSTKLPSWKMNRLMDKYTDHYGLPSGPNAGGLPR